MDSGSLSMDAHDHQVYLSPRGRLTAQLHVEHVQMLAVSDAKAAETEVPAAFTCQFAV
jgi:hypothetical protein